MQTLYQMGQVEEAMEHFHTALGLLQSRIPRTLLGGGVSLIYHTIKQFLRSKFPYSSSAQLQGNELFLDKARCLAHISYSYQLQKRNVMSLMAILKRLNDAERAQEYHVHEVRRTALASYKDDCIYE